MKKQEIQQIEQPNCLDDNGHLILSPIIKIAESLNCPYIALIGEKRIGKTFGCIEYAYEHFYKDKSPAFYVRRYDKTFTESICGNIASGDHRQNIINRSLGKHNDCELRGKYFDVLRKERDKNTGDIKRAAREHFLFCRSLNNVETETADDKGQISCVIYDEFLTRGNELKDEFNKLMIVHANATGKRTDKFTPMFLLGNTVSRDSAVAECFGIKPRKIKRGLNIITNSKGVVRIIVYYVPPTSKGEKSGAMYYDRFENDHINMISHGDWTLGTYQIASQNDLALSGFTALCTHNNIAVKITFGVSGLQPRIVATKPDKNYDMRITSGLNKTALNFLPMPIVKAVTSGYFVAETPEIGEDFRDICKHLGNGLPIVQYFE